MEPTELGVAGEAPRGIVERAGAALAGTLAGIGELAIFAGRGLVDLVRPPFEWRETVRQLHELGFRSLPLIVASGFAVGIVLSMHTRASLERFGAEALAPAGLAIVLVRETGPLTTGLLLSGRIGAGIGAELAAMKVTEQIDALEASAVDAFRYLVVTRVAACMLAFPILTTVMNFSGLLGGYVAEATITGMSAGLYFDRAFSVVEFDDYVPSTFKTVVFGFLIAIISSYLGFTATRGTEGVGQASTRSVVVSSIVIIAVNVLLVQLIFNIFPAAAGG
jgi:phospholipid/cholesterol/gamma-HCH transport system permease protein